MRKQGIILLDKPPGITSFQVLTPLKRALGHKKLGHTGTLDRFASGLLVLLAGPYTKFGSLFTGWDKRYEALVRFGEETSTLDPEGEVIAQGDLPSEDRIRAAMAEFSGMIKQRPPAYSAIHVAGKRAYERIRAGEAVDMPEREVRVDGFDLLEFDGRDARVSVQCSKGTYIRSLARDWALAAGSRAHLVELRRIRVGPFDVSDAVHPEDFDPARHVSEDLSPLADYIALGRLKEGSWAGFLAGRPMEDERLEEGLPRDGLWALSEGRRLAAAAERRNGQWKFRFVVPN